MADEVGPTPAEREAPSGPPGSPLRSVLAIAVGWFVLTILGQLLFGVLSRWMAADFPTSEGTVPTERGLIVWLLGSLPNGILAGLLAARIAGWAPIAHSAVLGGIVGFFAMTSADRAHGLPWWFAIGWIVGPPLGIVLGGLIARLRGRSARGPDRSEARAASARGSGAAAVERSRP